MSFHPVVHQVHVPTEAERPLNRWAGTDMSDEHLRALALGAWMTNNNDAFHDTVEFAEQPGRTGPEQKARYIEGLLSGWRVAGRDDALATVRSLHRGMHAPLYGAVHPLVMEAVRAAEADGDGLDGDLRGRHTSFLEDLAGINGFRENTYVDYYRAWTQAIRMGVCDGFPGEFPADIYAWDLSRAVWVTRAAVTAEYLTVEEAWPLLFEGLEQARARYTGWRQFGRSVVAGRYFWRSEQDLASTRQWGTEVAENIQWLTVHPLSPWRRVELHPDVPALTLTPMHDFTGWA